MKEDEDKFKREEKTCPCISRAKEGVKDMTIEPHGVKVELAMHQVLFV